jgi:hypothetical protein
MLLPFIRRPVPWWSGQAIRWEITRQLRQTTYEELAGQEFSADSAIWSVLVDMSS